MYLFTVFMAVLAPALVLAQDKLPGTAAFLGTPKAGQVSNGWKYLGCATEVDWRALPGMSFSDDKMTIEKCQTFCVKNNYILTGVEYGREVRVTCSFPHRVSPPPSPPPISHS